MAIKTDSTAIFKEFEDDKTYKTGKGFPKMWKECVDFKEGRHWGRVTEATKAMPRIVINKCGFIIENRKSNILSQTLKMIFSPGEMPTDGENEDLLKAAEDYTDAAAGTWADVDQDALNEDAVDSTLTKGTGYYHYFFDNEYTGGQFTKFVGRIDGETISPSDLCLGNPRLKPYQIQKQPFIIIRKMCDTDSIKEISKKNGSNWETIQPDEERKANELDNENTRNSNMTTTLIKYYKEDNQVYWTQVTETAVIQKPIPLAPSTSPKPFTLYPVEALVFMEIDECSLGRSIIQDSITVNKAINWIYGMIMLSVQGNAWPKILAKAGALLQAVLNVPGEIVTDHAPTPGVDGIKYMQPPNFSNMPPVLADKLSDLLRENTSTTEVNSGEALGANMAAAAIIAMQNQAQKPNQAFQNKLFRSMKNIGQIWQEFYKCYYNLPRPITGTDKDGNEITKSFVGTNSANINFGLIVDVGPAGVFTEALQMSAIQNVYDKKDITKYQFVKYSPRNIFPQEMKQDFEKEEELMKQQQEQQANMQQQVDTIMNSLSPEEKEAFKADPTLLDKALASMQGGQM
jgi:hypothetical protein